MTLRFFYLLIISMLAFAIPNVAVAEPDNIDVILYKNIPILVNKLRESEIRNIGVIPFRFKDNLGLDHTTGNLIQSNLAARTERVIAYVRDVEDPVNVVFDMLAQARRQNPNANYHDEASRKSLMELKYDFPVEETPASILDGYVTGVIEVSKDWTESTIHFELYDRQKGEIRPLSSVTFPTDRKMLMQYGRAYSLSAAGWKPGIDSVQTRSIYYLLAEEQKKKNTSADSARSSSGIGKPISGNPWAAFPVTLLIKYDGKTQDLRTDSEESVFNFSVVDPEPKQRVTFELKNNTEERIAVVLALNGRNLLYNENANEPDSCTKFILEPKKSYTIAGLYLPDQKGYQPLLGQDNQSTPQLARQYPPEAVGIITLSVFRSVPVTVPNGTPQISANEPKSGKPGSSQSAATQKNSSSDSKENGGNGSKDKNELWHNELRLPASNKKSNSTPFAKGSFHRPNKTESSKTWKELSNGIGQGVIVANSARGLIAPSEEIRAQKLDSTQMGPVDQTDVAIIRYFSVTQ